MFIFLVSCGDLKLSVNDKTREIDKRLVQLILDSEPLDQIEKCLLNGANTGALMEDGELALTIAVKLGKEDVIDLLLKQKEKNVNSKNSEGLTPLMLAVDKVSVDIVEKLLQNNAILILKDRNGDTALDRSLMNIAQFKDRDSFSLRKEIALSLLNKKRLDNLGMNEIKRLLGLICNTENLKLLKSFLTRIKLDDSSALDTIFWIVENEHINMLKMIIKYNPNISLNMIRANQSLLLLAIEINSENIVELLLQKDVKIDPVNNRHPLIVASQKGNKQIVRMLIKKGVSPNLNYNQTTPLITAIESNNKETVRELIELGANVNSKKKSPLLIASKVHVNLVEILIEKGGDIDYIENQVTPFIAAASVENIEVMRELLIRNVDYEVSKDIILDLGNEATEFVNFLNLYKPKTCKDTYEISHIIKEIKKDAKLVEWLSHGDSSYRSIQGITPLMYGAIIGDYNYVSNLVKKRDAIIVKRCRAHYQARDIRGLTALDYVLEKIRIESSPRAEHESLYDFIRIAKFLLNLYIRNKFSLEDADNVCRLSVYVKDEELFQLILDKFSKVGILIEASKIGDLCLVKKIFDKTNIGVDERDKNGNTALMYAGSLILFDYLLEKGANIRATDNEGTNVLMKAAQSSNPDLTEILNKLLLENGITVDDKNNNQKTPLMFAAMSGNENGISQLLINRPDVDVADDVGATALMYGAGICKKAIIEMLTRAGADLRLKDAEGKNALMYCARKGGLECLNVLLKKGSLLNEKDNFGRNVLIHAVKNGAVELIEVLSEKGLSLNTVDNIGMTLLMYGIKYEKLDVVEELIEKGVDINLSDNNGKTAIMYAAELSTKDMLIKLFTKMNIDVEAKDSKGKTALMYAVGKSRFANLQFLLEKGADITITDKNKMTALMYACKQHHKGLIEFLIVKFQDELTYLNKVDLNGRTALTYAIENNHLSIVENLISKEVDYSKEDIVIYIRSLAMLNFLIGIEIINLNDKLLIEVVKKGGEETAKLLMSNGISFNITNDSKQTLLMLASMEGHSSLVNLFLELGLDINGRDIQQKTALMLAATNGHQATVSLLIEKGADTSLEDNEGNDSLMLACQNGHEMLLDRLATVNKTKNKNEKIMIASIKTCHLKVVKKLIDLDIIHLDSYGVDKRTALMYAVETDNYEIVDLLLNMKVTPEYLNQVDITGKNASIYAAQQGNEGILTLLLNYGSDPKGLLIAAVNSQEATIINFVLIHNLISQQEKEEAYIIAQTLNNQKIIDIFKKYIKC